jgi:hypothetical protein
VACEPNRRRKDHSRTVPTCLQTRPAPTLRVAEIEIGKSRPAQEVLERDTAYRMARFKPCGKSLSRSLRRTSKNYTPWQAGVPRLWAANESKTLFVR